MGHFIDGDTVVGVGGPCFLRGSVDGDCSAALEQSSTAHNGLLRRIAMTMRHGGDVVRAEPRCAAVSAGLCVKL